MLNSLLLCLLYPLQIHMVPVKEMKYNHVVDAVISADVKGIIEYWSPATLEFPENEYILFLFLLLMSCIY